MFNCLEAIRVGNTGVQGHHVHGEKKAVLAGRGKRKVAEDVEGMVSVFNIGREGAYNGLKDEVQVLGKLFSGTGAGGDNGPARGRRFVDFGEEVEFGLSGFRNDEVGGFFG